jgi:hypothetical protein
MRTIQSQDGKVSGFVASFNELELGQKIQAKPFVQAAWGPVDGREHFDCANQMEFVLARMSNGRLTVVDARMP